MKVEQKSLGTVIGIIKAIRKIAAEDDLLSPITQPFEVDEDIFRPSPFDFFEEIEKLAEEHQIAAIEPYKILTPLTTTNRLLLITRLFVELKPYMEKDEFESKWHLFDLYVEEFVCAFDHD